MFDARQLREPTHRLHAVGVLWRRATREGAIVSMLGGLAGTVGWRLFEDTGFIDPVVPGFIASLGLMVVVSLLTAPPPLAATASFFDTPTDAAPAETARTQTGVR